MPERTESGKGTVEAFEAREGGEGSALPAAWAHDEGSAARTVWVGGIEHSSADEISVCEAFAPAGSIIAANVRTKYNGWTNYETWLCNLWMDSLDFQDSIDDGTFDDMNFDEY